jgi:hypothetical protein
MFRHTTLFCYVHLLNVTYVHKNFISCHVGLSFQKLKLLKNNHKILRPTTLISCRMMQEDWEGSDWQRKNSVLISVYIFVGLNICYYFRSYSPSFLESKTDEKTVGLNIFWRVGLNILVESVLIFSILVTRSKMLTGNTHRNCFFHFSYFFSSWAKVWEWWRKKEENQY